MDVEAFIPFLKANLQTVSIVIWIAAHAPERLDEFTAHLNQSHHKAMSDHLRAHANDSSDPLIQTLLESGTLEPIARWVLRQGPEEDDLRWALINDERLNIIERSKLLERLVGRAHEPDIIKRAEALRSATDEELLEWRARTYQPPHLNFPHEHATVWPLLRCRCHSWHPPPSPSGFGYRRAVYLHPPRVEVPQVGSRFVLSSRTHTTHV